jgi:dihydrofolate reductase
MTTERRRGSSDEFATIAASTRNIHAEVRSGSDTRARVHEPGRRDRRAEGTFDYGFDPKMGDAIGAVTGRCRGILLGRTTYEMFEPAWSTRTVEDDPGAPFFNDTTKYVVSGTLTSATWRNSKILGPYDPDAIRSLKNEVDGDLYVSGSGTLVRAMLAEGLVDELHLFVYPLTRGSGPRLFPEEAAPGKLTLAASESYDNGVVYLAYRPQA